MDTSSDSESSTLSDDARIIQLFTISRHATDRTRHQLDYFTGVVNDTNTRTLHHRNRELLQRIGIKNLSPLLDDALIGDPTHPFHALVNAHEVDSGFRLCTRDLKQFYSRFRVSVSEFYSLYEELLNAIEQPFSGNFSRPNRRVLTSAEMLLVWLGYADNVGVSWLSIIFQGVSRRSIDRAADHVTLAINAFYSYQLDWPDAEERENLYGFYSCYDKVVGIMDGTHCPIQIPEYLEYEHYSGYKGTHTQNYLITCDPIGFIINVTGPFEGRGNDRAAINTTDFVDVNTSLLSPGELILVDGGFTGPGPIIHQFTKKELEAETDESERKRMLEWNEEFELNRAMIEHVIHNVKNRAQALADKYPRDKSKQPDLFFAACKICNRIRQLRLEFALNIN